MTQCRVIFGRNWINVWKITKNRGLKEKKQIKSIKRRGIRCSLKWLCRIFPRNDFSTNFLQNLKFSKFSKSRAMCCRTTPEDLVCQMSGRYVYIWHIWQQKPYRPKTVFVVDVIFRTAILSISRHRTEIKRHFWHPGIKLVQKHTFFIQKYEFQNLTLYDSGLTRPFFFVDLHGVRLQNSFDFWILRAEVTMNHVPHTRKRIFDFGELSWPFVTWPWHWRVFSMTLMLTGYLQLPFGVTLAEFRARAIDIAGPRHHRTEASSILTS